MAVPKNQIPTVFWEPKPDFVHGDPLCYTKAPSTYHEERHALLQAKCVRYHKILMKKPLQNMAKFKWNGKSNLATSRLMGGVASTIG